MGNCMRRGSTFLKDERGATAIEYGLIISLVVLAMVGALTLLAGTTSTMWTNVSTRVDAASAAR